MTVDSLKTGTDPEVLRIGLSDGSLFFFRSSYVREPPVAADIGADFYVPGTELSGVMVESLREAAACFRAERAALRLIARAEQSVFGVKRKLEKRGHSRPCIEAAVARLEALDFLNDRRFAERWLEARLLVRPDTPFRLVAGLCSRGIPRNTAAAALASLLTPERERDLLESYLRRKKLSLEGSNYYLRNKLKFEGFSSMTISDCIDNCN